MAYTGHKKDAENRTQKEHDVAKKGGTATGGRCDMVVPGAM